MPMIAPGLALAAVHALLHHRPLAVVGDEEAVQIQIETVLHRGAVDLRHQTAGADKSLTVKSEPLAQSLEFPGRSPGMLAASAADVNTNLVPKRRKAALQRADDAGGNPGGMPVHSHHRAERLKPERMRQPLQEFIAAVMMDDSLADNGAKHGHALRQPWRNTPAVKGKIGAACSSCH